MINLLINWSINQCCWEIDVGQFREHMANILVWEIIRSESVVGGIPRSENVVGKCGWEI